MATKKKQNDAPHEGIIDATEFVELKRDMQSAKLIAWLQYNQQQLIAGAITIVLILVGYSLWQEQQQSQKEAAALLYIKAINTPNPAEQLALLDSVMKEYPGTGYATLATLRKSSSADKGARKEALKALIDGKGAPELVWQAKLDLAGLYVASNEIEEAKVLLKSRFGKHYEQSKYAMLASIEENKVEKIALIEKALAAESHDSDLVDALKSELATLQAAQ